MLRSRSSGSAEEQEHNGEEPRERTWTSMRSPSPPTLEPLRALRLRSFSALHSNATCCITSITGPEISEANVSFHSGLSGQEAWPRVRSVAATYTQCTEAPLGFH